LRNRGTYSWERREVTTVKDSPESAEYCLPNRKNGLICGHAAERPMITRCGSEDISRHRLILKEMRHFYVAFTDTLLILLP
jgi:hypothetical protein